ncbi:FERM, ARHGEF and pleckstrin domain-containing protein 2 [Nephila pilipes]|uniref:FERM, ARHGEF and pleckstrin domain-containing protein 2 n=1 Tax=Nephila pilipes TaxID=299642 RepID=A0A8X6T647_NEPPI|nr:FERM, ARHGEF and pleckstrin domain-containing protein 2 [Nephila pilipes]
MKDLSEICHQNNVEVKGSVEEITTTTNGDVTYILRKLDKSHKSLTPLLKSSLKPVLRVEVARVLKTQGNPMLYARAGCFPTSKNMFNHNIENLTPSKTVDFVSVSQLLAADNVSSLNDSLQNSIGKVLKECISEPISGRGMLKHSFRKHSSTDSLDMDYVISHVDGSYYRFANDDLIGSFEMNISKKIGKKSYQNLNTMLLVFLLKHLIIWTAQFLWSILIAQDLEYLGNCSSSSEILRSGNSTSSLNDMLQLSYLWLYETHISSSEEDPTVADDDEFD